MEVIVDMERYKDMVVTEKMYHLLFRSVTDVIEKLNTSGKLSIEAKMDLEQAQLDCEELFINM